MVYDYIITFRRPSTVMVDVVSQLLFLISFAAFAFFAFSFNQIKVAYVVLALGILSCWVWVFVKKDTRLTVYYTSGLALAAFAWFTQAYYNVWLGTLYVVAAIIEREIKFPKEIGFSKERIVFNSLFRKVYKWGEIKNVIIKEGFITVDFYNNKLIQKELANDVSEHTQQEFNDFCRQQLLAVTTGT